MSTQDDDIPDKRVMLFGRDLSAIPCFRSSFLYGIGGGIATGLVFFMCTSRTKMATHVGFSGFMGITLAYWFTCRYRWSQSRFQVARLQAGMQRQAMYEGTDKEKSINEMTKNQT